MECRAYITLIASKVDDILYKFIFVIVCLEHWAGNTRRLTYHTSRSLLYFLFHFAEFTLDLLQLLFCCLSKLFQRR